MNTYTLGRSTSVLSILLFCLVVPAFGQSGHVLNGVGAVDQGLSGAGMAFAQDASAAIHWNPASITALNGRSISLQLQVLMPKTDLTSSVEAGAFGPGFPSQRMAGTSSSEAGPFPIPALAYVDAKPSSRWAWGLSAFGVGGFGVEYDASTSNPILTPQGPVGFGFGEIDSQFSLLQVSPTLAYRASNKVSIGIAPTLNIGILTVSPFPAASPDDANEDGFRTYPTTDEDVASGAGFQLGIHIEDIEGFNVGASFKSTQKFESFSFDSKDEMGNPREFEFELDYPMIVSGAVAYHGVKNLVVAADVRYIDFANSNGFSEVGYSQTGAVTGFGWESIVVVAVGAQYEVASGVPLRVGYSYNDNPVPDHCSFFNVASPAVVKHRVSTGASFPVLGFVTGSVALQYAFENPVSGQWTTPMGSAPGTQVESALSTFTVAAGIQMGL